MNEATGQLERTSNGSGKVAPNSALALDRVNIS